MQHLCTFVPIRMYPVIGRGVTTVREEGLTALAVCFKTPGTK